MNKPEDEGPDARPPVLEATLMRFADGDLPRREHDFVAGLIAAHPDATGSVRAYRFTKEELPGSYEVAMVVPPELIDRCLPEPRSRLRIRPLALAASIAVLLAGVAGWLLHQTSRPDVAGLLGLAPPALQRALDTTLTGSVTPVSGTLSARVFSTFASLDRHWCRQYTLREGQHERARGIACRQGDGWHVVVQAASARPPAPQGAHIPAGGDDPIASYASGIMGGNSTLDPDDDS